MEKKVLENIQGEKSALDESEKSKISKACWIATIVSCGIAVILMIIEGVMGNYTSIYALGSVCFMWASVFYFCQYFIVRKSWPIMLGAILESLGAVIMMTFYILFSAGIL